MDGGRSSFLKAIHCRHLQTMLPRSAKICPDLQSHVVFKRERFQVLAFRGSVTVTQADAVGPANDVRSCSFYQLKDA